MPLKTGKEVPCNNCGVIIYRPAWQLKRGNSYCTIECQHKGMVFRIPKECTNCKNTYYILKKYSSKSKYCSRNCFREGIIGEKSRLTIHGMTNTRIYATWNQMKVRCYNHNNPSYKYYGARGIRVCDRWLESFKNFYDDMGGIPQGDYSIDRINNDGNYEPKNCRWATRSEQNKNKRKKNSVAFTRTP